MSTAAEKVSTAAEQFTETVKTFTAMAETIWGPLVTIGTGTGIVLAVRRLYRLPLENERQIRVLRLEMDALHRQNRSEVALKNATKINLKSNSMMVKTMKKLISRLPKRCGGETPTVRTRTVGVKLHAAGFTHTFSFLCVGFPS